MSNPTVSDGTSRRQRVALVVMLLALFATALGLAWPHLTAWSNLQQGKASLDNDPAAAREYLDKCLTTWPSSSEAHFLAARAARQCGELGEATRHLDEAARLGWTVPEVAAERALLQAEFDSLEALARALMADFRWPEAGQVVKRWLELQPDAPKAWVYQGQILERLRKLKPAVDAFRQAVRLAPDDRRAELDLARLLLESRQAPEEAAGHLERLNRVDPRNPTVLVQLAACREAQGRVEEAVVLLEQAIAERPNEPKASYFRGRLELNRGQSAAAVGYLRRAAELDPSDQEALYSLVLALTSVGTPEEIRAAQERWRRCDADLRRVAEVGRLIVQSPDDPDLRREMGELFLRNGRDQDGVRWLQSALLKRSDHTPTHRLLAEYYQRTGQPALAAQHRSFLKTATPITPVP